MSTSSIDIYNEYIISDSKQRFRSTIPFSVCIEEQVVKKKHSKILNSISAFSPNQKVNQLILSRVTKYLKKPNVHSNLVFDGAI